MNADQLLKEADTKLDHQTMANCFRDRISANAICLSTWTVDLLLKSDWSILLRL